MIKDRKRIGLLREFQRNIGYRARDIKLLNEALTHKSFINEAKYEGALSDNERLEFLGDVVLGLAISDYIYNKFRTFNEGELSKFRSSLVSKAALFKISQRLTLGKYLLLGKGEILSGGRLQPSNITASLEAVFGAVFLDRGFEYAYRVIIKLFEPEIAQAQQGGYNIDHKTILQEYTLKKFKIIPNYKVISEVGPGHKKEFEVTVDFGHGVCGRAKGFSKKSAQQNAAKEALSSLGLI